MPYEPILGQIMPAGFSIIPRGWAPCNGALMAISQNSALFSLLGTAYGGDGVRTFALPDLRGRALMGSDNKTYPIGQVGGFEKVTLNVSQLPVHTHALAASNSPGAGRPAGNLFGAMTGESIFASPAGGPVALLVGANVTPSGGGAPHNNMQPYLVVNYMIALQGLFPSRQ